MKSFCCFLTFNFFLFFQPNYIFFFKDFFLVHLGSDYERDLFPDQGSSTSVPGSKRGRSRSTARPQIGIHYTKEEVAMVERCFLNFLNLKYSVLICPIFKMRYFYIFSILYYMQLYAIFNECLWFLEI